MGGRGWEGEEEREWERKRKKMRRKALMIQSGGNNHIFSSLSAMLRKLEGPPFSR